MKKIILTAVTSAFIAIGITGVNAESASYSGTFSGLSDHITTGNVSVVKTENGGSVLILREDFSLDGAPDPSVAFGRDGKYDGKTNLGKMTKIKGMQVYEIPDDLDWSTYNEVYIWCEKFTVPLGVAKIK